MIRTTITYTPTETQTGFYDIEYRKGAVYNYSLLLLESATEARIRKSLKDVIGIDNLDILNMVSQKEVSKGVRYWARD